MIHLVQVPTVQGNSTPGNVAPHGGSSIASVRKSTGNSQGNSGGEKRINKNNNLSGNGSRLASSSSSGVSNIIKFETLSLPKLPVEHMKWRPLGLARGSIWQEPRLQRAWARALASQPALQAASRVLHLLGSAPRVPVALTTPRALPPLTTSSSSRFSSSPSPSSAAAPWNNGSSSSSGSSDAEMAVEKEGGKNRSSTIDEEVKEEVKEINQEGHVISDPRSCALCRGAGDNYAPYGVPAGRLLPYNAPPSVQVGGAPASGYWCHSHCALWSSETVR